MEVHVILFKCIQHVCVDVTSIVIKKFNSFWFSSLFALRFNSQYPGMVFYKEFADCEEKSMQLLKDPSILPPSPAELPDPLSPPGLSYQRQNYLYNSIREYCAQDDRADLTCPRPPLQAPESDTDESDSAESDSAESESNESDSDNSESEESESSTDEVYQPPKKSRRH